MSVRPSRREALALVGAALGASLTGCRRREPPGRAAVPPGTVRLPGIYHDLSPRWSNDGSRIAFLRATTDRHYQLFTANAELSGVQPHLEPTLANPDRPLRSGRAGFAAPEGVAWSPDDRLIAFPRVEWFTFEEGDSLPGTGLSGLDLASSKVVPLALHPRKYTDDFYYYRSPQWSSDGKRMALIGEAPDGSTGLLLRDLRQLDPSLDSTLPDKYDDIDWHCWSPDGSRLLFRQGILRESTADAVETLRLISPGDSHAGRLFSLTPAEYERRGFGNPGSDTTITPRFASPAWSPDGTRVAFTITPDAADRARYAIYVLDVGSGGVPWRVSPRDGNGYHAPVWIDGDRIGVLRTAPSGWDGMAVSATGMGSPRLLTHIPTDDFDWSPDRKRIVCASASARGPLLIGPTGV
jgi:Tol biopolymer transport system component